MELWIPITIFAAFMQNARSALQKHLKGRLTTLGASYVRFLYAMPFALIYVGAVHEIGGYPWPEANTPFLVYCLLGGVSQILFTAVLLWLFQFRNFAVGTTYSKTETVQVALLGYLIIGDELGLVPLVAIFVSVIGVMALSVGQTKMSVSRLFTGMIEKPTLIGLLCGALLGSSVVFFRKAALTLDYDGFVMAAAFTLAVSVVMQTVIMGAYLAIYERRTLIDVFVHWKWSLAVGVCGVLGSIGWFTAFTLENAAFVRALGQIELVFTFIASVFIFRETTNRAEIVGILLVVGGILLLVLGR
ncbi:MAG: EamA family transporter [Thalassobaculaceae bacterium]|nr:EamA family transporter [Thalassobaculaceae bacterium]